MGEQHDIWMSIELTERSAFGGKARQGDLEVDTGSIGCRQGKNRALNVGLGVRDESCKIADAGRIVGDDWRITELASHRSGV